MDEYKMEVARQKRMQHLKNREWYVLRSILGYSWAMFIFLLGGREAGKSYSVTDFYVGQWRKYGRPFYWLRLTDTSQKKLLKNNAEKLIDPDLRRKYNIELETRGDGVYEVIRHKVTIKNKQGKMEEKEKIEKKLMARVLALSTFYNDKGSGLFDKDFLNDPNMYYNVCLDEMNREQTAERNSFDIVYAFANQLENLVRSTKNNLRIICIGNTLEEASDILCAFNFLPEAFGRYKLKKKRAVVEYIEPSQAYKERRKGTVSDILMPTASTFTNEIKVDTALITKKRLQRPSYIIKFSEDSKYTVWDSNVIKIYHKSEHKLPIVAMRPYIDEIFNVKRRDEIIQIFDTRGFRFANLITQKRFKKDLELLKPRK